MSEERKETVLKDEEKPAGTRNSPSEEVSAPSQLTCVTVQPSRVLCGVRLKLLKAGDTFCNIGLMQH